MRWLLALLGLLALACTPASAAQVAFPGQPPALGSYWGVTFAPGASAPAGTLRDVATGNTIATAITAASNYSMCRKGHIVRDATSTQQLLWWNGFATPNVGETANAALPITGIWLEYPVGTYTQVTVGGSTTPTFGAGAIVTSDAIPVAVPNGAIEYEWLRAGPGTIPYQGVAGQTQLATTEGCVVSTTSGSVPSAPSGSVPGTKSQHYMPVSAVLAVSTVDSYALEGDSRVYGQADQADANFNKAVYAKVICPLYACGNFGVAGDTGSGFLAGGPTSARMQISAYYTRILDEYGTNDSYVQTGTLAGIQGFSYRRAARFIGKPYVRATVEPHTSSTDTWATPAAGTTTPNNQTDLTDWTVTATWNTFIRGAADAPYVENEYGSENVTASGYWSAGFTGDGLHANATGTAAEVTYATGTGAWSTPLGLTAAYSTAWAPTYTNNSATFTSSGCALGQTSCLNGGNLTNYGIMPSGTAWTIEFWMKTSTTAGGYVIGNANSGLTIAGSTFIPTANFSTKGATGSASIADGVWHQYDLVQNPTGGTLLQDCNTIASTAVAPVGISAAGFSFAVRAQGRASLTAPTQTVNNTLMQEISIWNYAKTCAVQSAPYAGTESGLIADSHLNNSAAIVVGPGF